MISLSLVVSLVIKGKPNCPQVSPLIWCLCIGSLTLHFCPNQARLASGVAAAWWRGTCNENSFLSQLWNIIMILLFDDTCHLYFLPHVQKCSWLSSTPVDGRCHQADEACIAQQGHPHGGHQGYVVAEAHQLHLIQAPWSAALNFINCHCYGRLYRYRNSDVA